MGLFGFCGYACCNTKFGWVQLTCTLTNSFLKKFYWGLKNYQNFFRPRWRFWSFHVYCCSLVFDSSWISWFSMPASYSLLYYIIWGSVPSRYSSLLAAKLVWWLRIILFLETIIIFVFHLRHFS